MENFKKKNLHRPCLFDCGACYRNVNLGIFRGKMICRKKRKSIGTTCIVVSPIPEGKICLVLDEKGSPRVVLPGIFPALGSISATSQNLI